MVSQTKTCPHSFKTEKEIICKDCKNIVNLMDYISELYDKAFKAGREFEIIRQNQKRTQP